MPANNTFPASESLLDTVTDDGLHIRKGPFPHWAKVADDTTVTALEAVQYGIVATVADLPAEVAEQGDRRLVPSTGVTHVKQPDGTWEPDVTVSRLYVDNTARLNRTGFEPVVGETVGVNGSSVQYRIVDATDASLDQPLGSEPVVNDTAPTAGSTKPVQSQAIKSAFDAIEIEQESRSISQIDALEKQLRAAELREQALIRSNLSKPE